MAGGMPLAFTQEDCLVFLFFNRPFYHDSILRCEFLKKFCCIIFYSFVIEFKDRNDNSMLSL